MKNGKLYTASDAPRGSFAYLPREGGVEFGIIFGSESSGRTNRFLAISNDGLTPLPMHEDVYVVEDIKIIVDPKSIASGYGAPIKSIVVDKESHLLVISSRAMEAATGINIETGDLASAGSNYYYYFKSWGIFDFSNQPPKQICAFNID